jgi:MoaA/NifB/PqqE/SkfB family radical SAM enzyme
VKRSLAPGESAGSVLSFRPRARPGIRLERRVNRARRGSMLLRKAFTQLRMAARNPAQVRRVVASELKVRAGMPTLRSVEFAVTWICNLRCEFCYAEDLMYAQKRPPDITVDMVRDVMKQAHKLGMIHVNITGGEPMIRKDLCELIDVVPKDVVVSVVTNSTLLTEEKLREFKKAGVSTVQMSYGAYYLKHFRRELARYARSIGLGVTLSVVNIKSERENIEAAMRMAEEDDLSVLWNYPMRYKNDGLDPELYWKYRTNPRVREDNMFWAGKNRCPAGTAKVYVTNDGDVMTCDRIHGSFGNLHQEPLEKIWKRMYAAFKDVKSYCLLETCPLQFAENNAKTGKKYDPSLLGSSTDPFNVFKGTKLEKLTVPATQFTREMLSAAKSKSKDVKPPKSDAPIPLTK